MRLGLKNVSLVGILLIILLVAFIFLQPKPFTLDVSGPGYFHLWRFSGETPTEWLEGPKRSLDPVNFPFHFESPRIIEEASKELIVQLTHEMEGKFAEQGIKVTVMNVTPSIQIVERWETRQFRDYEETKVYYRVKAGADVVFETDRPVEFKPRAQIAFLTGVLIIIGVTAVIGAFIVFPAIADWIRSFGINESSTETVYYDDQGNIIKTEKNIQKGSDWQAFIWIAVVVGIIGIIGLVVVGSLFGLTMFGRSRICKRFGGDIRL